MPVVVACNKEKLASIQRRYIRRARAFIHERNLAKKIAGFEHSEFDISITGRGVGNRSARELKVKTMPLLAGLDDPRTMLNKHYVSQSVKN
jgi:hypothetical protein